MVELLDWELELRVVVSEVRESENLVHRLVEAFLLVTGIYFEIYIWESQAGIFVLEFEPSA